MYRGPRPKYVNCATPCATRFGELVFGIAAARGHEGAKGARDAARFAEAVDREKRSQQRYGKGVVENVGLVENLVNGAPQRHAKSSFAGAALLHTPECI